MTDRIEELRALAARPQTGENPVARLEALLALEESMHALLDCAEMLDKFCTGLEWNIENHPEAMNQADEEALAEGRAALAKLNGDDNAG